MNTRPAPLTLSAYYAVLAVVLYVPIGVLFLFSVNDNTILAFPLRGLTLRWYASLLDSEAVLRSARNSLVVAAGSSLVATALGTILAILAQRFQFRLKRLLVGLAVLPLIVPYVILAVSLFLLFALLEIPRGLLTVAIAHTVVSLPYTFLIVSARMASFDPALEEAAMDLGADFPTAQRRILLPIIFPTMISAWLTAFTVSFDEFALALFLAGTTPTFPVYLFSQLRFANRLPVMIALSVVLMVVTLLAVFLAERVRRLES